MESHYKLLAVWIGFWPLYGLSRCELQILMYLKSKQQDHTIMLSKLKSTERHHHYPVCFIPGSTWGSHPYRFSYKTFSGPCQLSSSVLWDHFLVHLLILELSYQTSHHLLFFAALSEIQNSKINNILTLMKCVNYLISPKIAHTKNFID